MLKVSQSSQLTLHDVETKFDLKPDADSSFFTEWQIPPAELSEYDRKLLDQAQASFKYLLAYPMHEEIVKKVIISPLLYVASFYSKPFRSIAEQPTSVEVEAENEVIRGRIDVLLLNDQLWVGTVEAKGPQLSWHMGLPQTLTYMMSKHQPEPAFGLITNGSEAVFVKLHKSTGQYGLSRLFSLFNPGNDLYAVVSVLKAVTEQ